MRQVDFQLTCLDGQVEISEKHIYLHSQFDFHPDKVNLGLWMLIVKLYTASKANATYSNFSFCIRIGVSGCAETGLRAATNFGES